MYNCDIGDLILVSDFIKRCRVWNFRPLTRDGGAYSKVGLPTKMALL